jgi:hypothetical protein
MMDTAIAPSAPAMIAPQSVARPPAAGAAAPTMTSSVTAMAGLRAMTLPPMFRTFGSETCAHGNEIAARLFLRETFCQGDASMAGILLWLMGVPLLVILLLYLIF